MAQDSAKPAKKNFKKKNFKKKFNKKNSDASKTSFMDSFGEGTALKLKQLVEKNIKQKIKDAQNDPKVKEASEKFNK